MDDFEPINENEYQHLMATLKRNSDKTFVQRILRPNDFPVLDDGNGGIATHRMAWGEADGKYVAFPTVLYDGKQLVDHGKSAFDQVMKSGNYITFDSPHEAEWFSKRYKGAWGGVMNKPPR